MRIQPVSLSFKSNQQKDINNENKYPYLYTASDIKQDSHKHATKIFNTVTAIVAIAAVVATLVNLRGHKKFPDNIIELSDKTKGLNKLERFALTKDKLKSEILYPLKCAVKGDNEIAQSRKFRSGLILTGDNNDELANVSGALVEHIQELGINTVSIDKKLKQDELNKQLFERLDEAKNRFNKEGKYTVIDLGKMSDYTNLEYVKPKKSQFEEKISEINNKNYPGVIWIGWIDKKDKLPLFFYDLPISMTKLMD